MIPAQDLETTEEFYLDCMIKEVLRDIKIEGNIDFIKSKLPQLKVMGCRRKLMQCLHYLITNSLSSMTQGYVRLEVMTGTDKSYSIFLIDSACSISKKEAKFLKTTDYDKSKDRPSPIRELLGDAKLKKDETLCQIRDIILAHRGTLKVAHFDNECEISINIPKQKI